VSSLLVFASVGVCKRWCASVKAYFLKVARTEEVDGILEFSNEIIE
jgi:hypothetical protein